MLKAIKRFFFGVELDIVNDLLSDFTKLSEKLQAASNALSAKADKHYKMAAQASDAADAYSEAAAVATLKANKVASLLS